MVFALIYYSIIICITAAVFGTIIQLVNYALA